MNAAEFNMVLLVGLAALSVAGSLVYEWLAKRRRANSENRQ